MNVGVVAIGRNEGERLAACLRSARRDCASVVYVDSNSTDGSVALAESLGVHVVKLDLSLPFTAARARNEGFEKLRQVDPSLNFVQFVDGDCEIDPGWIEKAVAVFTGEEPAAEPLGSLLAQENKGPQFFAPAESPAAPPRDFPNAQTPPSRIAVVCGRRRERFPRASIYNRLCDMEWNTPIGPAKACGGDAMIRVSAFIEVGGYDPTVIAGEEPEMCVRLRQHGWTIRRIDAEMTLHDAAMTRFSQWWKRNVRAGHAYAQGNAMHGGAPEFFRQREIRSIVRWATVPIVVMCISIFLLAIFCSKWYWLGFVPLLAYLGLVVKIALARARSGNSIGDAIIYGVAVTLGKFPQFLGVRKYFRAARDGRQNAIIEYKGPATPVVRRS